MNERLRNDELSPLVRKLRRCQVILAVCGMACFLFALVGGAMESRLVAIAGLSGFGIALLSLIVVGVVTWAVSARQGR